LKLKLKFKKKKKQKQFDPYCTEKTLTNEFESLFVVCLFVCLFVCFKIQPQTQKNCFVFLNLTPATYRVEPTTTIALALEVAPPRRLSQVPFGL